MASLPKLEDQGDGMRSFFGQLLPILTGAYRIIIVDEPEAFLHPPQAHGLGVQLGRLAKEENIQVLLATHDRSFLTGLLDSGVDVSVVRLERDTGSPRARTLEASALRKLWLDPMLKYTNILDGLFHRLVVAAEAEGDCAFLQAALDCRDRSEFPVLSNDVYFVPTTGIGGMAKVGEALTAVGVPVVLAPDLDVLKEKPQIDKLVRSLGSEWGSELHNRWQTATHSFRNRPEPVTAGQVLRSIESILGNEPDQRFTRELRDEVNGQLRASKSPWEDVKQYGVAAFKGEARTAATELLELLNNIGIVPLEAGELESLAPNVERRKGTEWLVSAIEQGAHCEERAQTHIEKILKSGATQIGGQRV